MTSVRCRNRRLVSPGWAGLNEIWAGLNEIWAGLNEIWAGLNEIRAGLNEITARDLPRHRRPVRPR
jgi:hypothetical protein